MQNYSWDVVYACSGNYINRQLAQNAGSLIQSFNYEDAAVKISGQFGAWQIVPGGSGPLLQFVTPITKGTVQFKTIDNVTIPLDGAVPLVQMQLCLPKGRTQSVLRSLVFNCTTSGKKNGDTTPGAVTVINPDTSGVLNKLPEAEKPEAAMAAALLQTGLQNVFLQNVNQLNFVFANVLPVPVGQNADWLTPVNATYCYQQPIDNSLGGIAILGMLDNTSIDTLPRTFDTSLLAGKDFGFILSARAFMKNVILQALPGAFQGNCNPYDFNLNPDNTITLREQFNLNSVRVGLIDYTPTVDDVKYEITDQSMRCYVHTNTDITGLTQAYVTNSVSSNNQSAFNVGTRTLSFQNDPNMSTTQDKHIPCWEEIAGALTFGVMNAVVACISLAIEDAVGDMTSSKTAQSLGNIAPGLVSWSGQQNVNINAGGLSDNVYMQGSLN